MKKIFSYFQPCCASPDWSAARPVTRAPTRPTRFPAPSLWRERRRGYRPASFGRGHRRGPRQPHPDGGGHRDGEGVAMPRRNGVAFDFYEAILDPAEQLHLRLHRGDGTR